MPIFRGHQRKGHDAVYWKWAHGRAVQQGKWKLVKVDRGPWELYDIQSDRTELVDLAERRPGKVRELESLWEAWLERTEAME